jgi:chemotaxis protein CheY-P-specific phosphatase CheC
MSNYRQIFATFNTALALALGITILPSLPSQASDITSVLGADLNWQCGEMQPSLRVFPEEGNREFRINFLPCNKESKESAAKQNDTPSQPDVAQLSQQLVEQGVQLLKVGQPILQQVIQQLSQPPANSNSQR